MAESHPDFETLARYVRGGLGRGESRTLEEHLARCLACQAAVEEIPAAAGAVVHWAGHRFAGRPEPEPEPAEEARRARWSGTLAEIAGVLGTLGEGFAARLLAESEHGRRALIRSDRRFQSTAVCAALLTRCREAWFDHPAAAVELGKLAIAVASHLEAGGPAAPWANAWKALAWMHLGNAYRIASQAAAAAELAEAPPAGDRERSGGGSAAFLGEAPVRREEAEAALREVGEAFLARGLDVEAALVVLELAAARLRQGRPEDLAPLAAQALAQLEAAGAGSDAVTAVERLSEAAQRGEVTAAWLEETASALRRTREDPGRHRR